MAEITSGVGGMGGGKKQPVWLGIASRRRGTTPKGKVRCWLQGPHALEHRQCGVQACRIHCWGHTVAWTLTSCKLVAFGDRSKRVGMTKWEALGFYRPASLAGRQKNIAPEYICVNS